VVSPWWFNSKRGKSFASLGLWENATEIRYDRIPLLGKLSLGVSIFRRVWYKTSPYTMKKGGIYCPGDDEIGKRLAHGKPNFSNQLHLCHPFLQQSSRQNRSLIYLRLDFYPSCSRFRSILLNFVEQLLSNIETPYDSLLHLTCNPNSPYLILYPTITAQPRRSPVSSLQTLIKAQQINSHQHPELQKLSYIPHFSKPKHTIPAEPSNQREEDECIF